MSREKQIDEIAKLICSYPQCTYYNIIGGCEDRECILVDTAEKVYNAGYRKQSEGEWEQYGLRNPQCSLCHKYNTEKSNFCPNCGAKMKGGAEQ